MYAKVSGLGPVRPSSPRSSASIASLCPGLELEIEQVEVFGDPGGRRGFRKDDVAALEVPAEHELGGGPMEPAGDTGDYGVTEDRALSDRGPGLGHDAVLCRRRGLARSGGKGAARSG